MAERPLKVGDSAPAFSLAPAAPAGGGAAAPVTLQSLRGKKVVLYFYPKDDTPGCTREACGFQASQARLAKAGAVVLGVSGDSPASHRKFADKFSLQFPLLSDPDKAVCKAYGVYGQKSMYGRTYFGIVRTTFVIDEAGRIQAVFPKVKVDGHVEEVLEALRAGDRAGAPSR